MVLLVRLTVVLGNLMVDMCMFIGALCEASRKGLVLSNFKVDICMLYGAFQTALTN
jgi:hypothetical protein